MVSVQTFQAPKIEDKLKWIERDCERALQLKEPLKISGCPERDIQILPTPLHPPKKGFSQIEGQARLLHDLANIELQAMELGLRTLCEFPEAPASFKEELLKITLDEARHLGMCIEGLEDLGFKWGSWPIHTALWEAANEGEDLLDRVFIVHRYLEGSGLDAGEVFSRRLDGVINNRIQRITSQITDEEVDHVYFGSHWFRKLSEETGRESLQELKDRLGRLKWKIPKRVEQISHRLRLQAGFTPAEIEVLENLRTEILQKNQTSR